MGGGEERRKKKVSYAYFAILFTKVGVCSSTFLQACPALRRINVILVKGCAALLFLNCIEIIACTSISTCYVATALWFGRAHYGMGSGLIALDDVRCDGSETMLNACPHVGPNAEDCTHYEDVGVLCKNHAYIFSMVTKYSGDSFVHKVRMIRKCLYVGV